MGNRRFGRKTNAFSKRHEQHERQLALTIVYRNYCLLPRPKRQTDAKGKPLRDENGKTLPWIKRLTPAMQAGLVDMLWETEDLLVMADAFTPERRKQERQAKEAKAQLAALFSKPKENAPVRAPSGSMKAPITT